MQKQNDKEKRKFIRVPLCAKLNFQVHEKDKVSGESLPAVTKNISMKGICFVSEKQLTSGSMISIELHLPGKSLPLHLEGQIRWSKQLKQKGPVTMYESGVTLFVVNKNDEGRLADYICEKAFGEVKSRHL